MFDYFTQGNIHDFALQASLIDFYTKDLISEKFSEMRVNILEQEFQKAGKIYLEYFKEIKSKAGNVDMYNWYNYEDDFAPSQNLIEQWVNQPEI